LLCASAAVALLIAAAPALASSTPGTACSQQTVSAVNEYCENIPSATGGNQSGQMPFSDTSHGGASGWSLFSGLAIAMVALALALSAVALARRRRVSRA
jgi:hypothetical protein